MKTNERAMKMMERYLRSEYAELSSELYRKNFWGKGNKGYGSSMDDYNYCVTSHYNSNDDRKLFLEYSSNHPSSDTNWIIDDVFESLYDVFGEKLLVEFIYWFFNIDLNKPKNDKYGWYIESLNEM